MASRADRSAAFLQTPARAGDAGRLHKPVQGRDRAAWLRRLRGRGDRSRRPRPQCLVHCRMAAEVEALLFRSSGFVHRDPVINALSLFRKPFTFGDIVRDPRFSNLDREMLRTAALHGWSQGLVVPVARGGTRFGLVADRVRRARGRRPAGGPLPDERMPADPCARARRLRRGGDGHGGPEPARDRGRPAVASGCSDGEIATRLGFPN